MVLPIEQWQQILVNVSPGDLCNVVLTSRYMNLVASWPDLWANMKVNISKVKQNGLSELYSINRFSKIRKLDFSKIEFTSEELEKLFKDIAGSPLTDVNLENVNIKDVPAELVAKAVCQLETVNMAATGLTTDQCVEALEASLSSNLLVNLNLELNNLYGVPPELLGRVVFHLQSANLGYSNLTTDQCVKIWEEIFSSSTLVSVKMKHVNLSGVPANLLAKAVAGLNNVDLYYTDLTTDQCVKILEACLLSSTLVELDLTYVTLREVPGDLLARAFCHIPEVRRGENGLTRDQRNQILKAQLAAM